MGIGVVIVTYNRLEKLKISLRCFAQQSILPAYVLVINNASTDATGDFLQVWSQQDEGFKKYIVTTTYNTGGSGGFYTGLELAEKMSAEWIWLSDDDAFPEQNALAEASQFLENYAGNLDELAAICGQVINKGKIDLAHRKNMRRKGLNIVEEFLPETEYQKPFFELNCFSYVGAIIHKEKLAEVGLTNKDYFLWWDDTEHSLRLSEVGKILCVPSIKIHHDVTNGTGEFTWKTYYGFRNMADLYRRHFPRICYKYFILKLMCKTYIMDFMCKNKDENEAIRCSLRDCRNGKFGIHEVYKPGWRPQKR